MVGGAAIAIDCKSIVRLDFGGASPSPPTIAHVAQLEEHILGKNEVRSANLRVGSNSYGNKKEKTY